jgi:hypothetical protein
MTRVVAALVLAAVVVPATASSQPLGTFRWQLQPFCNVITVSVTQNGAVYTLGGDVRVGTGTTGCVKDADATVIAGTCSSDARFKRDVTPFPSMLDRVARLQPVNDFWRADAFPDKGFGTGRTFGLVAQDVEQVFPDLVTTDAEGFKAVNDSKLPLLAIQAIRELRAENDDLRRLHADIERRYRELAGTLAELSAILRERAQ